MIETDPAIKMLLRLNKAFLVEKAQALNLISSGTKLELAIRIAKFQEEESSRIWMAISNSKRRVKDDKNKSTSRKICSNNSAKKE